MPPRDPHEPPEPVVVVAPIEPGTEEEAAATAANTAAAEKASPNAPTAPHVPAGYAPVPAVAPVPQWTHFVPVMVAAVVGALNLAGIVWLGLQTQGTTAAVAQVETEVKDNSQQVGQLKDQINKNMHDQIRAAIEAALDRYKLSVNIGEEGRDIDIEQLIDRAVERAIAASRPGADQEDNE